MQKSKLSDHVFKKGKFITPFNSIPMMKEIEDEKSWTYGRMPEYLWMGLILKYYGRTTGLEKLYFIIEKLHKLAPPMYTARMSEILNLEQEIQEQLYDYMISNISKEVLAPLTIFLTTSKAPMFSRYFYSPEMSIEDRCDVLMDTMKGIMGHQTNESTDIRFVALYFTLISGRVYLQRNQVDLFMDYPYLSHSDPRMQMISSNVRALELLLLEVEDANMVYIQDFWRCISEMTECSIYSFEFLEEKRDIASYMKNLHEIFVYLTELFKAVSPLDEKMNVILGIATYSYKRFKEAYEHNLFNSISGRSCVRVLIEDYIMIKYLVKNESSHENIWRDYQLYGLGLYKLVLARHRENEVSEESHFDQKFIEALVNEFKEEEFIDMDTKYFDKQNIRLKAESVNEKDLFGLYYDYDSSFEHGLWGAIRESSLLKCTNPAHKYHCVPDVEDANRLKSVLPDCIMVMNKMLSYLDELYGIPQQLLDEVINFEIKPVDE